MINAAERLSKRVRAAMGDHNNDDLPVTQCVINKRKDVVSLQTECEKLVEALESAKNLIANHSGETLPEHYAGDQIEQIDDAIAAYRKQGGDTCS